MFVFFKNLFYRIGHKIIQIFAFGQALLGALEAYASCAVATSGRPSLIHGFGLCQHDLTRVHVVTRAMQREQGWGFLDLFLLVSSSEGFTDIALRRLGSLVAFTELLGVLILLISSTLRLEYFLSSFEALTELEELCEALGCVVKPLDDEFFLPPLLE